MRRTANPGADRAAQNAQTLKTLVKVESNKTCADCKRNKHPRWASWNLGIFICIRCSGIHRGMGTHISRVKSVDLDAWTDEQLASMLKWGNARANKYWEAKLAPGHVPAEAKIENFIRTKYDSKRWAMDGGMPDPSTLDTDADDDVPLNIVQEKAKVERSASLRQASTSSQPPPIQKPAPDVDLFGDPVPAATITQRSSSAAPNSAARVPPPQTQKPRTGGDSLLGFDFLASASSNPPSRPSSAAPASLPTNGPSRGDLKQSILSLYASVPKTNPPASQPHSRTTSAAQGQPSNSFSGLSNDFSSLSFGSPSAVTSPTSSFGAPSNAASRVTSPPPQPSNLKSPNQTKQASGGNFFDAKPKPANPPPVQAPSSTSFGDFGDFTSAGPTSPPISQSKPTNNGLDDLFDFSPTPTTSAPPPKPAQQATPSPFNLSAPKATPAPAKPNPTSSAPAAMLDPWGNSDDVWSNPSASSAPQAAPAPAPAPAQIPSFTQPPAPKAAAAPSVSSFGNEWSDNAWGNGSSTATPAPTGGISGPKQATVTQDEDFGGWESSAPATTPGGAGGGSGGVGRKLADDPFDNPWG